MSYWDRHKKPSIWYGLTMAFHRGNHPKHGAGPVKECADCQQLVQIMADSSLPESPEETVARFWSYVQKGDGCWVWVGSLNSRGYGKFALPQKAGDVQAHRLSWQLTNGPIADGLMVCHKCDNPPCVNPDHLYPGTALENTRDAIERNRMRRSPGRGVCPVCGGEFAVRVDYTIRDHGPIGTPCPGVGASVSIAAGLVLAAALPEGQEGT